MVLMLMVTKGKETTEFQQSLRPKLCKLHKTHTPIHYVHYTRMVPESPFTEEIKRPLLVLRTNDYKASEAKIDTTQVTKKNCIQQP